MSNENPWKKALTLAGSANADQQVMQVSAHPYSIDKCPRCGYKMEKVKLSASSDRAVLYCMRDRVAIPLPVSDS